jgi:hypothetical protein
MACVAAELQSLDAGGLRGMVEFSPPQETRSLCDEEAKWNGTST